MFPCLFSTRNPIRDVEQRKLEPEIMELSLEEKIRLAREKLHNDIRDVEQELKSLGFDGMELDDQVRMLGMKLKDKKQNECPTELLPQVWDKEDWGFKGNLDLLSRDELAGRKEVMASPVEVEVDGWIEGWEASHEPVSPVSFLLIPSCDKEMWDEAVANAEIWIQKIFRGCDQC
ncbi:hypothetical protein OROHE_002863 [Orobanche hederae]